MIFTETPLQGAYLVDIEKREDERGFFARGWCQREFEAKGLVPTVVQANISNSKKQGTLRGMHFQAEPYGETKLVRCTRGAIYDVIVDLRPESETYKKWFGVELSAENYRMLYVPKCFAHGFETLLDDSEVNYLVSEFYSPKAEGGLRFNDPSIGILWPIPVQVISEKDNAWPDFNGIG